MGLRDRFDNAEAEVEYQKSLKNGNSIIPNDYCRPICDDNGDFEMEQHCNRDFMKTEEPTGGCITWDNNAEDSGFVYNFETQKCEKYTKCRYDKYLGKPVECDENGLEFVREIIVTDAPNLVTDVTDADYDYGEGTTNGDFTEAGPASDLTTVESIQLSTL